MKYPVKKAALYLCAVILCAVGSGCNPQSLDKKTIHVKAEYLDLANQRVAIMVAADSRMLYAYPKAPDHVCTAITSQIAKNVPGVTTTIPEKIAEFQQNNPYWSNMRYSELVQKLSVDKLVLIDLIEYQTHEPGNANVWQGIITANVSVIDAHAVDPDNFVFQNTVSAQFPENSTIGVINSDDETIQLGMLYLFAQRAGGLFFDHDVEVDR